MAFNSTTLMCFFSDLCHRPLNGRIVSIILHLVRPTSMSELRVTMLWHALSILLIHHCISLFSLHQKYQLPYENYENDI